MNGRKTTQIALVLLVVATIFRLWATQHARFTGDESDYWQKSRKVAVGSYRPVFGPEITGSEANLPGPAYYYLMAVPQALGASPFFGSVFVVLGHALAGWLLFLLARRARGDRAGLIALALFMFAPWDVLYADRIWGSCVVPIWGALALYASTRSSGPWQAALVFLSLVLPQLHLSVPVLWLACGAIVLLRPPERLHTKWIAFGVALAILAYLDPLISEFGSNFANTKNILSKGTGKEPWSVAVAVPFQVFGYAVGYASSEIGYHFARGYWGGRFDDVHNYLTVTGWQSWFSRHGPILGALGVVSIGVAIAGWLHTVVSTLRASWRAITARSRAELELGHVLTIALVIGFGGGALLMMMARKRYFPHYANILMPIALWPAVMALDTWFTKRRALTAGLVGASVASMFFASVRYYRNIDTLNGLANTIESVEAALADGAPVRIEFTHFQNTYAWRVVAEVLYGRPLPLHGSAPIRYRVHNHERFEGEAPPGGEVRRGLLVVRTPPRGDGAAPVGSKIRRDWTTFEVTGAGGRACVSDGEVCRYGDQPWQKFGPDFLEIGGRLEPVLFLHPVSNATITAAYPVPSGHTKGRLKVALSDGAVQSNNRSPVVVTLSRGERTLGVVRATNRRGFSHLSFTLSSTSSEALNIEVTTENDGARIFGFDLEIE